MSVADEITYRPQSIVCVVIIIALIVLAVLEASVVMVTFIIAAVTIVAVIVVAVIIVVEIIVAVTFVVFSDACQLVCALIFFFCDLKFYHGRNTFTNNLAYTDVAGPAHLLCPRLSIKFFFTLTNEFNLIISINKYAFYCITFCIEYVASALVFLRGESEIPQKTQIL